MSGAVAVSEIIRNYAIVIAGFGGAGVAIWRAFAADRQSKAQLDQAVQGRLEHASAQFSEAISDLDHEKLHMRLSAILMLKGTVEAYPELSGAAVKILTAYLSGVTYSEADPPADVREILHLIIPAEPAEGA